MVFPMKGSALEPSKGNLKRSYERCMSFGGRLNQYYVNGRFHDCSQLRDCLHSRPEANYSSVNDALNNDGSKFGSLSEETDSAENTGNEYSMCAQVLNDFLGFSTSLFQVKGYFQGNVNVY